MNKKRNLLLPFIFLLLLFATPVQAGFVNNNTGTITLDQAENASGANPEIVVGANGIIISGLDSATDSFQFCNAAKTICLRLYIDATLGGLLDTNPPSDALIRIPTDKLFTLYDVEGSRNLLQVDPDSTGNPVTITAGFGLMRTLAVFRPQMNEPPTANFATLDTRNSHPVLDFDPTTDESVIFSGVMPIDYNAGNLTVLVHYAMTSAVAEEVIVCGEFERIGDGVLDIDADSFGTQVCSGLVVVPGTSGFVDIISLLFDTTAKRDSIAAGESFRLRITRDANGTGEDAAGDLEFTKAEVRQ